jgi:hypothetical protein
MPERNHKTSMPRVLISSVRAFLAISILLSASLFAQQQATKPATAPAALGPLKATVTGVEGIVQVRLEEDKPWQAAKVGMVLGEGAEFRTGPKSAVRFVIPPDQTITLDRLGTVKLLEAVRTQTVTKTDLGMKYGRVRYDIEAAGIAHDATIRSPGNTLAVRGTVVSLYNQAPFPPAATSLTGRATFRSGNHAAQTFGGTSGSTSIRSDSNSAAQTALSTTFVDPTSTQARSTGEQTAITATPLVAGFSLSPSGGSSGGGTTSPPPVIVPPVTTLPGSLAIQLVWIGTRPGTATPDLDLFVLSPRGEQLCPKDCAAIVGSGGRSPNEDRGGPANSAGQEIALWPDTFPKGTYQYGAHHVSGPPAEFQVIVLRNGEQVGEPQTGTLDNSNNASSFTVDLAETTASTTPAARQKAHAGHRRGQ